MTSPNFLIIGAARAGTTTLYSLLQEHPQVYLPAEKRPEPHFFLKRDEYAKGLDYYRQRYFAVWEGQPASGEASTSYLLHEWVAERIARDLPGVRLVVLLRHPVERAYSGYWHTVRSGLEKLSFAQAVQAEMDGTREEPDSPLLREIRPYAYLERGFYNRQLNAYLRHFPKARLGVWLLEDLTERPAQTLREVLDFLGVDSSIMPQSGLDRVENRSTPEGAAMAPALRARLVDLFRPDVESLAGLLQRDLGAWLR